MINNPRLFSFVGSNSGSWRVTDHRTITGDPLNPVTHISVIPSQEQYGEPSGGWVLRGVTSNERYVTQEEKAALLPIQPALARPEATLAAMIPMRKNNQWWSMSQDQRRAIFHRSSHNQIGTRALPAIARRLHHCRDLATPEPFDFVTWFEFAPEDETVFDLLLLALRKSEEWQFIDREFEIRLRKSTDL